MVAETIQLHDLENDRQERIRRFIHDTGKDAFVGYETGSFGCHELLDRTHMLAEMIEAWVQDHPACLQNSEWYALADQAVAALQDLYQKIGQEHLATDTRLPLNGAA